jgi:hypothetical protein
MGTIFKQLSEYHVQLFSSLLTNNNFVMKRQKTKNSKTHEILTNNTVVYVVIRLLYDAKIYKNIQS